MMSQAERQNDKRVMNKITWCASCSTIFRVVYYWEKFLGINPLILSKKNKLEYSYFSMLYGCFLAILYCYTYYSAIKERFRVLLPGESPTSLIADFLGTTCQFLETSSTWFVFAIYQNRVMIIVKSFGTAEKTLMKLGIPDDRDEQFKQFGVHLILINILFLLSIITSNMLWSTVNNLHLYVWVSFNIPPIASFNAGIILIWCLILVRRKFRRLNETVQFLGKTRCNVDVLLDRVDMISQLHRELRNIICDLEKHFSLYVLFCIGFCFFFQMLNCYRIYRYMKGHPREAMDLLYLGASGHWFFYSVMTLLVTISCVCGSTSDEANSTGSILHKLLNTCKHFDDFPEAAKLNSVSLDLLKNQISMSIFGLIKLDHFLVYRTLAMSANYVTVMLQFYD